MKTITIIKTAAYDPTLSVRYGLYDGYCLSTLQKTQPHITVPAKPLTKQEVKGQVYCSTLTRSIETARLHTPRPQRTSLLNEVLFDLKTLVTEAEFESQGSGLVRQRFVEAFVNDQLLDSRAAILARVKELLQFLKAQDQTHILCVSHSFFMKVLEAYIKTSDKLEAHPDVLAAFISSKKHTYPYMEGFEFKL